MSQIYRQSVQSKQKSTRLVKGDVHPRIIFVCAWCPDSSYKRLKSGEVYTHGMCDRHLAEWTNKVRKRLHN